MLRPALLALVVLLSGCAPIQGAAFRLGVAGERARSDLAARHVDLDGTDVHYLEREGEGPAAETIVLLHGFAGSKDHWIRFVRHLPPRYRVLAPDLPGHGDNPRDTTAAYTVPALVSGVERFLDRVSPSAVHLVGNSLGGQIATELALARPARTRSLALFDPAGLRAPEPSALDAYLAGGENLLIPTTQAQYERLAALAFGDPPSLPWPADAVVVRQYRRRAPFYRRVWRDLFSTPSTLSERLPGLRVPALLIWGEADGVLDVSAADRWAALAPGLTVERWPGVGHAPMLERPEESAARYARFLADR